MNIVQVAEHHIFKDENNNWQHLYLCYGLFFKTITTWAGDSLVTATIEITEDEYLFILNKQK